MKKTLAIYLLLITTSPLFSRCTGLNDLICARGVGLGGYWELSPKYYPKTVTYFDELKIKYPALKPIEILILNGPMADNDTIYFPMSWIEKLEKGNKFYKESTEWIILHELGHIVHKDIVKMSMTSWMLIGGYFGICLQSQKHNDDGINTCLAISLASIGAGIIGSFYLKGTMEYAADDYAMQHCTNPEAWIAAYEFLERKAPLGFLPGIFHSFTKYRLSRIAKAFNKKFDYELTVIPQSLYPTYDTPS